MPVERSNTSRKQRRVSGPSSNPRNNLDPYARLASHVLVNAGREYRSVVAQINDKHRTKKEIRALRSRREAIRAEIEALLHNSPPQFWPIFVWMIHWR